MATPQKTESNAHISVIVVATEMINIMFYFLRKNKWQCMRK